LVLNHFDKPIPNVNQSLIDNFNDYSFNFDSSISDLFDKIDEYPNPASQHMVTIKELGETYGVNYVLINRINHLRERIIMDAMLFSSRSGGLIHRRKVNVTEYDNGQINELNLWIGSTLSQIEKEWKSNRESILFLDPSDITYDKTPMGAAMRSLILPGWGQAYSGNLLSAGIWASIEASLAVAFFLSYGNYDLSAKSFLNNLNLYDASDDEKEIANHRSLAEKDWDDHVFYSRLAIALAGTTVTGWISNSIHAWIFGPRPYTNIYQKGIPKSKSFSG
tara:strand:- start:5168 stop:6001 length:834 start_codon:yes stop_codon:yes gene_type:complete